MLFFMLMYSQHLPSDFDVSGQQRIAQHKQEAGGDYEKSLKDKLENIGYCWLPTSTNIGGRDYDVVAFSESNQEILLIEVVIRNAGKWQLVSFSPTSSIRFEKWGARSISERGLKAIVGKTTIGKSTMLTMRERICIHATPVGITPNLFQNQIQIKNVCWFDELGSVEAARILKIKEFGPFLVDIDCEGRNYFDILDASVDVNRKKAYQRLNILDEFEYTKLY